MKQLALATLIASAGLVGCNTYDTANHGKAVSLEPSHNFLASSVPSLVPTRRTITPRFA